jgi:hypothetical protein
MRIALHTPFAASKKEPLAETAGRVRRAFLDAGLGEPQIRFTLMDTSGARNVSAIDRVLKRHPEMERFLGHRQLFGQAPGVRALSNVATGEAVEYSTLAAIASGVPRSYPFGSAALHFYAPDFGERLIGLPAMGNSLPGVVITDNWWISGRQRALSVYTVVEAEETDKKLPPNPAAVDAVMKACGKARKTVQVPILAQSGGGLTVSIPPANQEAVKAVVADYRARIKDVVAAAGLPHSLPPAAEIRMQNVGVTAGPRKPALVVAFKPMGYDCTGGTGVFRLTRRTGGNHTVELYLDVGTWSHSVTAIFMVQGAGFKASLGIPVAVEGYGQYPIGDAAQWQKIVENLAVMVQELDRTFVPAIEAAAGPSPAWYQPPS